MDNVMCGSGYEELHDSPRNCGSVARKYQGSIPRPSCPLRSHTAIVSSTGWTKLRLIKLNSIRYSFGRKELVTERHRFFTPRPQYCQSVLWNSVVERWGAISNYRVLIKYKLNLYILRVLRQCRCDLTFKNIRYKQKVLNMEVPKKSSGFCRE